MRLVPFNPHYYEKIKPWWAQYGWEAPRLEVLPKIGFVALKDETPIAAGFYYQSCSGMAYMDWIIADRDASLISRGKAVYRIVERIIEDAKVRGFHVLYTVTANSSLIETYKKIGLSEMESGATTLALSLNGVSTQFLR